MELSTDFSFPNVSDVTDPCEVSNSSYTLNASSSDCATQYAILNRKEYWALVMIPLPLVAVFGNILVILSVYKEKSLQTATNYFIVSLAFADLLVAAVVMPFAVYVLVNVDWELSETLCDFYIALDVTCSTASIFNLVAISIDRFIAVTQPIKYSKHKNHKRVFVSIAFVWIVSAAIGSPIVLGLNTSPERVPKLCVFYNSDFIIYSSLSSFYIPCLVMVYLYYKIFKAIHERVKKAIGKKITTRVETNNEGRVVETVTCNTDDDNSSPEARRALLKFIRKKRLPALDQGDERSSSRREFLRTDSANEGEIEDFREKKTHRLKLLRFKKRKAKLSGGRSCDDLTNTPQLDVNVTPPSTAKEADIEEGSNHSSNPGDSSGSAPKANGDATCSLIKEPASRNVTVQMESVPKREEDIPDVVYEGGKRMKFYFVKQRRKKKTSTKKRERNAARRERKATKTLAIVLGVFLMCWLPFFTCNVLDAICIKLQKKECRPGVTAFLLTTWLGYINSCVNPVIYTIFNIEFRKAFKKLVFMSDQGKQ